MNQLDSATCIYCGGDGPFTDEHVVSAGLGGDDRAWLLEGCVCSTCNTNIFSPLETKFLKSSGAALARLFLQPHTRDKTKPPSVQPKVAYHHDTNTDLLLEAELRAGGLTLVYPQILFLEANNWASTAADDASHRAFPTALVQLLGEQIAVIEKAREHSKVIYRVILLRLEHDAYVTGTTSVTRKPPTDGIWFEPLTLPATAQPQGKLPPRIFQRPAGQLVCRVAQIEHVPIALTAIRANLHALSPPNVTSSQAVSSSGGIHQRFAIDTAAYDRVLTKTGVNLCAKLFGPDFVRAPAFAQARDYARTGQGGVLKHPPGTAAQFANSLGSSLHERHVLALLARPGLGENHALLFMARLYGGPMEVFILAEFDAAIPSLAEPILIHVDYVRNQIHRLSLADHAAYLMKELNANQT